MYTYQICDMWLSNLVIGTAQPRSVTESTLKSPFLCVNRSPIPYRFCAGGKNYPVWCEQSLSKAWLAQLGKRRSAERDVAGSNPSRTNTQGL